jgi:predicted transcriptional regulator
MDFKEPQKIIFELLELITIKPTSYYKLEKISNRHYSTVRTYINLLELLGFIEIKKIVNGKYIKYEITITPEGERVKERIKSRVINLD